jgi:hypothetical protein
MPPFPRIVLLRRRTPPPIARRRLTTDRPDRFSRQGKSTAVLRISSKGAVWPTRQARRESMLLELSHGGQAHHGPGMEAKLNRTRRFRLPGGGPRLLRPHLAPRRNFSDCLGPFLDAFLNPAHRQETRRGAQGSFELSQVARRQRTNTTSSTVPASTPSLRTAPERRSLADQASPRRPRPLQLKLGAERISVWPSATSIRIGSSTARRGPGRPGMHGRAAASSTRWAPTAICTPEHRTARESWIAGLRRPRAGRRRVAGFRVPPPSFRRFLHQIARLREGQAYGTGQGPTPT